MLASTRRHCSPLATMRRFHLATVALLVLLPTAAAVNGGKALPAAAKAPAPPPALPNITAAMVKGGCKAFVALVAAAPDALSTFQTPVRRGRRRHGVLPHRRRRAVVHAQVQEPHHRRQGLAAAVPRRPVYYTLRGLKSNKGVMNTLATDGAARNYNFTVQNQGDQVTIRTEASDDAARVESTLYDKDPIAVYALDTLLEPVELFDPVEAPAPSPAADAPKASSSKRARHRHVADAPGPGGDDAAPADRGRTRRRTRRPARHAYGGSPPCL
ncbi:hypothetical protein ACP70R_015741 [Stipagrostis hirtigluma subsp. patula]